MDSILTSVKKMLGIEEDYTYYDPDIIMDINSVLMSLDQLGVGPPLGFEILGKDETWADLIGDRKDLNGVKTYIYLKVRLLFDPPSVASVLEATERQIKELEWRLYVQMEKGGA